MGFTGMLTEIAMKEIGRTMNSLETEHITLSMVVRTRVHGEEELLRARGLLSTIEAKILMLSSILVVG